jgi:hypothetical protein
MHPEMQEKIADIARRYGVSKSWVANTFTAAGMRFSKQEPFYNVSKLRRVKWHLDTTKLNALIVAERWYLVLASLEYFGDVRSFQNAKALEIQKEEANKSDSRRKQRKISLSVPKAKNGLETNEIR